MQDSKNKEYIEVHSTSTNAKLHDEFELPKKSYKTPVPAESVLVVGKKEEALSPAMQKNNCSGMGKAMHVMQYSKPEMYNAVRDLSCHMHKATQDHYKAMLCALKYSLDYVDRGLVIEPNRKWDGNRCHKFVISRRSDLNYAKEPNNRRSVLGHVVYVEGASAMFKSSTERMCHCPIPRQRHMQVLLVFKTCCI
jgi:hypothetical protein